MAERPGGGPREGQGVGGDRVSVRMSGLGGQGAVTAAHILGSAAHRDGLEATVNPFFGGEKRLAPAESYVRIARQPIHEKGEVLYPDVILIFHPHVITKGKCYTMPFFEGLRDGGVLVVNSEEPLPLRAREVERLRAVGARLHYVPATRIAQQIGGTELSTNIAMLGALYGVRELTSRSALEAAMAERFGGGKFVASGTTAVLDDAVRSKYAQVSEMVERNMEIVRVAAGAVSLHAVQ